VQPPLEFEHLSKADMAKLAAAVVRFERAWQEQTRRDDAILAALVRALRRDGTEVDQFPISTRGFFKKCCQSQSPRAGGPFNITCTP
jgi:hypothetical protein